VQQKKIVLKNLSQNWMKNASEKVVWRVVQKLNRKIRCKTCLKNYMKSTTEKVVWKNIWKENSCL
jgi:hypothetical protein